MGRQGTVDTETKSEYRNVAPPEGITLSDFLGEQRSHGDSPANRDAVETRPRTILGARIIRADRRDLHLVW